MAQYLSTPALLMGHMEDGAELLWHSMNCATVYVWVCLIGYILRLVDIETVRTPKFGGIFLATCKYDPR